MKVVGRMAIIVVAIVAVVLRTGTCGHCGGGGKLARKEGKAKAKSNEMR